MRKGKRERKWNLGVSDITAVSSSSRHGVAVRLSASIIFRRIKGRARQTLTEARVSGACSPAVPSHFVYVVYSRGAHAKPRHVVNLTTA